MSKRAPSPHEGPASEAGQESAGAGLSSCLICEGIRGVAIHHIASRAQAPHLVDEPDNQIPLCDRCHTAIHEKGYEFIRWRNGYRYEHTGRTEVEGHPHDWLLDPEGDLAWDLEYTDFPLEADLGTAIQQARQGIDALSTYLPFMTASLCRHLYQEAQELNSRNLWRLRAKLEQRALDVTFGWHENGKPWGKEDKIAAIASSYGVSPRTVKYDLEAAEAVDLEVFDGPRKSAIVAEPLDFGNGVKPACPDSEDGRHHWVCECCGRGR